MSLFNKRKEKIAGQQVGAVNSASLAASSSGLRIAGKNIGDFIFENITRFFAFVLFALVIVMAYEMFRQSTLSIHKFSWGFITGTTWVSGA